MFIKSIFVTLLVLGFTLAAAQEYDLNLHPRAIWKLWQRDNAHLKFTTPAEEERRYSNFVANIQLVKSLNAQYGPTTLFMLNQFAHMTQDEFQKTRLDSNIPKDFVFDPETSTKFPLYSPEKIDAVPTSYDWRTHTPPVVTAVKDQGACGSCWAFSTNGNIEGQWALAGNGLVSLSEQNLVDCCFECWHPTVCDQGCEGGLMANTFQCVIKQGGVDTEVSYPYTAKDGFCRFNKATIGATIDDFAFIQQSVDQMTAAVYEHGPISIAVDASVWQFYKSGVFNSACGKQINHAVLIVGFGVDATTRLKYWIIKNSWGTKWGQSGYMLLKRGGNECGSEEYPITSIIAK